MAKGAINLSGIPKILMQIAGTLAQRGWYTYLLKPKLLKGLLHQAKLELTKIQPFLVATTLQPIKVYLTTDACDYGWGGTLQVETKHRLGPCFKAHQMFTPLERERHITCKETIGSTRCLQALWNRVPSGAHVYVTSDATCCVAAWNKGSSKPHLNECVCKMKCLLTEHNCTVEAAHLAGAENGEADHLSRLETTRGDSTVKISIL